MFMIEFCHINKTFKKDFWSPCFKALSDVSFEIEKGEATGFLGANGAGKTTLLKILMDFIQADSGEVLFDESLGKSRSSVLKKIGFMPERPYFYPHLSGRDFALYMGKLNDVESRLLVKRIEYWAGLFGISDALDRPLHGYSKGMLQRLGLTSSLLHDPEILILDEPLSGLDPIGRKEIKNVIQDLASENKTVFLSSHIVSDIEEICKKVVVLEHGHCVYNGDIEELINENSTGQVDLICTGNVPSFDNVKTQGLNGEMFRLTFEKALKSKVLAKLLDHKIEIIRLEDRRPSLEQVIYNIKEK